MGGEGGECRTENVRAVPGGMALLHTPTVFTVCRILKTHDLGSPTQLA